MKRLKQTVTILTLTAFICSVQGCASGSGGTSSGVTYNQRGGSYSSPQSHSNYNSRPSRTYAPERNGETHTVALAAGVTTGVVLGIAALATFAIYALPQAFAGAGID